MPKKVGLLCMRTEDSADTVTVSAASVLSSVQLDLVSLHIRNMWETTVMHKQVSGRTVNFGPNFPDQSLLWNTPPPPHFGKLQICDDQSLLRNTPPILKNFRFGMTKVYSGIPPPPFRKTSDLGWPKFTPEYPPIRKISDLGWPKFTLKYPPPPILENFRFGMTKVYSEIPPHFGKLQIWDDQSLLRNTPPQFRKTSDLGWPKFYSGIPPPASLGMSRVITCGDFIQPG